MNKIEKQMYSLLLKLKDNGTLAVKAEFEAEGTRTDELLRLHDLSRRAGVKIALKVGGCEAVKDLIEVKQFGVDYVIAPMVETPYALEKFILAKNRVYKSDERNDVNFLVNIETETSFSNIDNLIKVASKKDGIDGVVFGRVDYVGSKKLDPDRVDDQFVVDDCCEVAKLCKENNLDFVVGGGVSNRALPNLLAINNVFLSRFETRKIIFSNNALKDKKIVQSLLDAVEFELLWLLNKREYYGQIIKEDDKRYKMLNNRWKLLNAPDLR